MEPYELAPEPATPSLPGQVWVRSVFEDAVDALAADLFMQAGACVRAFGDFHLALSAGELIEQVYMRLMIDPSFRELPWKRTHLWVVAEDARARPAWSDRVLDILADHSDMPGSQVHPLVIGDRQRRAGQHGTPSQEESESAARRYERQLQQALGWRERGHDRLDCALLCLRPDDREDPFGLAPGARPAQGLMCAGGPRVSMSYRLLAASRFIGITAAGSGAHRLIEAIEQDSPEAPRVPRPVGGRLAWYLDEAAAGVESEVE